MTLDFDAGKYAPYVWSAMAAIVVVLGGLTLDTLLRARKWRKRAEELEARKKAGTPRP